MYSQEEGAAKLYCLLVPFDSAGPATVTLFDVDDAGLLVERSTHPTGGSGRAMSSEQDLEMDPRRRWLVVSNNESNDLTVFSIGSGGSLDPVPGSPFPTGAGPTRMAFHPILDIIYVSHWQDSSVRAFEIHPDGSLSSFDVETLPAPRDLEVDAGGRHLYVADMSQGVLGYEISDTGTLTSMPGSPFRFPSSRPTEVEISADGHHVLALDLDNGIAAFDVDDSGSLTLVEGSPLALGEFASVLEMSSDYRHAYVGFHFKPQIGGFALEAGKLPRALPGSPFPAMPSINELALAPDNGRLYAVSREQRTIQPFSAGAEGQIEPIGAPRPFDNSEQRVPNGAVFAVLAKPTGFIRGDANADRRVSLTDAIFTLDFLFRGQASVLCEDGADSNDDGQINLTDAVFTLDHLFRGAGPLPAPGPDGCGNDPTADDALACAERC